MEISEATGKILGMVMAYGVSSLGLLLAYYNYRKRIVKAEEIFTPVARRVIALVVAIAITAAVLGAASIGREGQTGWEAIRENLPGIAVPVLIFAFSFWMTWMLYRHFARRIRGGSGS